MYKLTSAVGAHGIHQGGAVAAEGAFEAADEGLTFAGKRGTTLLAL
jgi:hypothetical protein